MEPSVALVTGAGQRIGRAIALGLAERGYTVAVHCNRSTEAAEKTVAEIETKGGRAAVFSADLADKDAPHALVRRAVAALGPLTCLINNASVFEDDRIETLDCESWDRHLDVNLRAPLLLTQAFAGALADSRRGVVVNILDQRVWNLTPYFISYTVSKSALWSLTRTLAMALAPRIRVNAIGPGPTLPSARQSPEQFESQQRSVPLGRGATPEEIAGGVRFLVDASAMTGQMIALDGGQHLGWAQASNTSPSGPEE